MILIRASVILAFVALPVSVAAQGSVQTRAWLVSPLTGYPDVIGVSATIPLGNRLLLEPGVSILLPGLFARVGYTAPVLRTDVRQVRLVLLGGGRAGARVVSHGGYWLGPTAEIGLMSYPRDDSEGVMFLTVGAWARYRWGFSDGVNSSHGEFDDVLPSVRLGFGRAF